MDVFWAFVIIGGPLLLFIALNWAKVRTWHADKRIDPGTPSDVPAQGMGPRV